MMGDSGKRPEPVLRSMLVPAASAVIGLLVSFGVPVTAEQRVSILELVTVLVGVIAAASAWWARRRVTPVESPRDADGAQLVRADGRALLADRVDGR